METLQETARAVTSKPVQRVVVNTVLLVSSAATLFCMAGIASALFFQNFVPDQVVTMPVHLQYGSGPNPFGIASLNARPMKAQQDYDISVTVDMPRSPANIERGNFMVSLYLLDSVADGHLAAAAAKFSDNHINFGSGTVLFESRRSALVPYVDPLVSLTSRVVFMLYHMFVPGSQTVSMVIPLAERVIFTKGSAVPSAAYVEIEAGQSIQTYSVALTMTAQLRGLRWLMFHYRLPTYVAFTFLFWACELVFMGGAWVFWTSVYATDSSSGTYGLEGKRHAAIEAEEDQESDHPHNFPTYGRQPPLKHEPEVKSEADQSQLLAEIPFGGEADDEEDEDDEDALHRDSGIGTSYSEGGSAPSVRRRASRRSLKERE